MVEISWATEDGFPLRDQHVVQLYRHESQLVQSVSDYVQGVLKLPRQSFLLVATKPHWEQFRTALGLRGVEVERLQSDRRLIFVPVEEILPEFMRNRRPDPHLFKALATRMLKEAQGNGRYTHVHVYGELVNALVEDRAEEAAEELENLWNELRKAAAFSLFCGYALKGKPEDQDRLTRAVSRTHTHTWLPHSSGDLPGGVLVEVGDPKRDSVRELLLNLRNLGNP